MIQRGHIPRWIPYFNALFKVLLAAGIPLGFNGLVTIRGRKGGLPRSTPVAIIAASGRRWVWAPGGDVQWVRNLRAAGRATITVRRRAEGVGATELDTAQRIGFFRDVLGPLVRGIPFGRWFIRMADGVDLDDPVEAADGRPVFELHPIHCTLRVRSADELRVPSKRPTAPAQVAYGGPPAGRYCRSRTRRTNSTTSS